MRKTHKIGGTNIFLTVLLFLGCITVLFPLYMTVMIAFKNPSEMTNDVAGALRSPVPGVSATSLRQCVSQTSGTPWATAF